MDLKDEETFQYLPSELTTKEDIILTPEYMRIASQPSSKSSNPSPKLIVLDLNGTLLHRKKRKKGKYRVDPRPFINEFLEYLFNVDTFSIMIWSSARPENVDRMVREIFGNYRERLMAIWGRDKFGLSEEEFFTNFKPIKNLEIVWKEFNEKNGSNFDGRKKEFNQTNTILIDDSPYKAQLQPFNAIHLSEFERNEEDRELLKIIEYLKLIKYQSNVSTFIKEHPFNAKSEN
ncbi:11262_t:CDS:1 [Diversispora eburnea]|uniref:Mitochondrial import inner membrane translocase subunit TIM50 n=1 Tax=Diversispora eburnea TaxID=1213867 RepID=A0A9N8VUP6_9GLOM|nr:11262_t:CDS:1 [Diversispora eburnea]